MNKRGFTLVELLAVITILGIIMLIAVPNVMSLLDKNKRTTYVVDAKKLVAQAEYRYRMDHVNKPIKDECVVFRMSSLDTSEITVGPEGTEYVKSNSFVAIVNKGDSYDKIVTLYETKNNRGIKNIVASALDDDTAIQYVSDPRNEAGAINLPGVGTYITGRGINSNLTCRVSKVI